MTKTSVIKQWTRPQLTRLGSIADVANVPGGQVEAVLGKHLRS